MGVRKAFKLEGRQEGEKETNGQNTTYKLIDICVCVCDASKPLGLSDRIRDEIFFFSNSNALYICILHMQRVK